MARQRVLIVDAEPDAQVNLQEVLEASGLEVDAVSQAEAALQKLSEHTYAAIILDWSLSAMEGLAVLRQVAQRFVGTRVIMTTVPDTVEAVVDAMKLGAVDFLQKPFQPLEVREVIGRVLSLPAGGPRAYTYEDYLHLAQKSIAAQKFRTAFVYAHKAVFVNGKRPEAFDLLKGLYKNRL